MINDKHFVELHNHTDVGSNVRMRDSSLTCEELITITESWGNKAVAITDHESICSHIGAINTLNTIIENDKEDELMDFLEEIFDEVTDVQLNDFLWFDSDYIFEHLGIENED